MSQQRALVAALLCLSLVNSWNQRQVLQGLFWQVLRRILLSAQQPDGPQDRSETGGEERPREEHLGRTEDGGGGSG